MLLSRSPVALILSTGAANAFPFIVSYEGEAPGVETTTATFGTSGVEDFENVYVGNNESFSTDFGAGGAVTGAYQNVQVNYGDI